MAKQFLKKSKLRGQFTSLRQNINYILKFNVWFIHGIQVQNGHKLAIIFGGDEQTRNFIINLAFGDRCEITDLGKRGLYDIILKSRKIRQECCLMIFKVNETLCKLIKKDGDFYIPLWIHGNIDISSSMLKRCVKSDSKKIKKENLSFKISKNEIEIKKFYEKMYLPYMHRRHGNETIITKYKYIKKNMETGICDLILISKDNEDISGALILYEDNIPCLWLLGIKDGDESYLQEHASAACYYFASKYLHEQAYKSMNVGGSRAFLNDGVLQFKKRRGLRVLDRNKAGLLMKPVNASEGLRAFFLGNPFIYVDRGELCGTIFVDNDEDCCSESLKKLCKCFWLEGLDRLKVCRFRDDARGNGITSPAEISQEMTIRVAD